MTDHRQPGSYLAARAAGRVLSPANRRARVVVVRLAGDIDVGATYSDDIRALVDHVATTANHALAAEVADVDRHGPTRRRFVATDPATDVERHAARAV